MKRVGITLTMLLLLAVLCSCAPLPGSDVDESVTLPMIQLDDTYTIPAEWGSLAAVSNSSKFPDVFQLWFENEAGEIHLVVFNNESRALLTTSRVIARR